MNDSLRERLEELLRDVRRRGWEIHEQMMNGDLPFREWEVAEREVVAVMKNLQAARREVL